MNCDRVQAAISSRMDGEHLTSRLAEALDVHLDGCSHCRAFADRAASVRTAVRIRPAEQVPDLIEPIMAEIVRDRARRGGLVRRLARQPAPARIPRGRYLAPAAAALVVGLVSGSVLVGGPWQRPSTRPIAAAAVIRDVQDAASSLDGYRATFAVTERGLSVQVPERHLSMDVAFRAPARFRIDVRDETDYPSPAWTPTNLTYIANRSSTYRSGPTGCPSDLPLGVCPPTRATVERRTAFSVDGPLPADLVIPLTTLSSASGVRVLGTAELNGRQAVRVQLSFERARPLFPFLSLGGTWRPFFPSDRVVLWLDRETWFPLRYTVYPSADPARRAWELRFGMQVEAPARPIFEVQMTSLDQGAPPASAFRIPGGGAARALPLAELAREVGYLPLTPVQPQDLRLSAAILPPESDVTAPTSLLSYTRGLSYLLIGERRQWSGPGLFGPVDLQAERVTVGTDGVAYYEPATASRGRVLAIHAASTNLFLETNLSRERLLSLAASLPVSGEPIPAGWRTERSAGLAVERVSVATAEARAPFPVTAPAVLPPGYALASAELVSGGGNVGVTLFFTQRISDVAGRPIRLHVEQATTLPPASSAEQVLVRFPGAVARWTPSRNRLEWVRDGLYRSLDGPDLDLSTALTVALSIPRASSGTPAPSSA